MGQPSFLELNCVHIYKYKINILVYNMTLKMNKEIKLIKLTNYLHARTFPMILFLVKSDSNESNFNLKILVMRSGRSDAFRFVELNTRCISGQLGLHVNVINKSGNPT